MLRSRAVFTLATTVTRTSLISNLKQSLTSKDSCDNVSYGLLKFVLEEDIDIGFDVLDVYLLVRLKSFLITEIMCQ